MFPRIAALISFVICGSLKLRHYLLKDLLLRISSNAFSTTANCKATRLCHDDVFDVQPTFPAVPFAAHVEAMY